MSNFLLHSAKARYQRGSMHYLQRDERREGIMQSGRIAILDVCPSSNIEVQAMSRQWMTLMAILLVYIDPAGLLNACPTFCYTRPKPDISGVLCTIYSGMSLALAECNKKLDMRSTIRQDRHPGRVSKF
jgi:hypothetical protein